jgi:hypothetical protein
MGGKHLAFSTFVSNTNSVPLSSNKRWIIYESGKGWNYIVSIGQAWSHLKAIIGEDLDTISLIIAQLKELGFNCIRYTWATHMFTCYSTYKVGETFDKIESLWC